jgi:hypothetical protein
VAVPRSPKGAKKSAKDPFWFHYKQLEGHLTGKQRKFLVKLNEKVHQSKVQVLETIQEDGEGSEKRESFFRQQQKV